MGILLFHILDDFIFSPLHHLVLMSIVQSGPIKYHLPLVTGGRRNCKNPGQQLQEHNRDRANKVGSALLLILKEVLSGV